MKHYFHNSQINYDGSQLRSNWISESFCITDSAIVSFAGKCNVLPEFMVDLDDLNAGASIYSEEMLHFILEHKKMSLREIVLRQRLLICIIKEALENMTSMNFKREGDDLYDGKYKLTVSIATTGGSSGLVHAGINVSSKNTPVPTKGLKDYSIETKMFASLILENYVKEHNSLERCLIKVKFVD